ncbi:MAG: hypothetical protein LBU60_00180 [Clostridiales bacterium]|nr:hypothetical protein [Clostridiales bacterium]
MTKSIKIFWIFLFSIFLLVECTLGVKLAANNEFVKLEPVDSPTTIFEWTEDLLPEYTVNQNQKLELTVVAKLVLPESNTFSYSWYEVNGSNEEIVDTGSASSDKKINYSVPTNQVGVYYFYIGCAAENSMFPISIKSTLAKVVVTSDDSGDGNENGNTDGNGNTEGNGNTDADNKPGKNPNQSIGEKLVSFISENTVWFSVSVIIILFVGALLIVDRTLKNRE